MAPGARKTTYVCMYPCGRRSKANGRGVLFKLTIEVESNNACGETSVGCVVAAVTARQFASGPDLVLFTPSG